MAYISIDGVDFYRFDDYDKALTLLVSRRYEDIIELTAGMTKISTDTSYDLANGVTIQFTDITVSHGDTDDGLQLDFLVMNNRTDKITDGLTLSPNYKLYLYDRIDAVEKKDQAVLLSSLGAESSANGFLRLPLDAKTDTTISQFGRVIGVVYFEMYGSFYYIDLGDYFR